MRKTLIIILCIITNINLNANPEKKTKYNETKQAKVEIDTIIQNVDKDTITLLVFRPINCKPQFINTRPDSNNTKIKLSVAAAFTGPNLKSIMGNYIIDGKLKRGKKLKSTGYAVLLDNKVIIKPYSGKINNYKNIAIKKKGYLFQQMLLVKDSQLVPCRIFGKAATYRRALVIIDEKPCVIESAVRLSIDDFSRALIRMGIKNALCLDMGTWSKGWLRTENDNYTPIGKLTSSTKDQTNWLIFTE
ncbi:MAG: hypothetical protein WC679_07165 [Bacteroidales bacterium]|jgi:hypothetical protein